LGLVDAPLGGLAAQIASGLVRQRVTALENAGPLHDPIGIEAEALVEMVVGDHGVGNIAARSDDPHSGQTTAAGAWRRGTFGVHVQPPPRCSLAVRPKGRSAVPPS